MCAVYQTLAPTYWQGSIAEPVSGAAQQQGRAEGAVLPRRGRAADCCKTQAEIAGNSLPRLASTCLDLAWLGFNNVAGNAITCSPAPGFMQHIRLGRLLIRLGVTRHCHAPCQRPDPAHRGPRHCLTVAATLISQRTQSSQSLSLTFFFFSTPFSRSPLLSLSLSHFFSFYLLY